VLITMTIRTREQLSRWLDEQFWLRDAHVEILEPSPQTASPGLVPPKAVRIGIDLQIAGGIRAGERRRMRRLHMTASGVTECSLAHTGGFSPGHCAEGAELLDTKAGLGLSLDVPAELRLACQTIDVEQDTGRI
jgi:hypothetical protein